jgi:hypothetical protein
MNHQTYTSCLDCLTKMAEEDMGKRRLRALKHVGAGVLGLGLGTAAGKGVGYLLGSLDKAGPVPGARLARWIGPLAGAGTGLAYSLWKQQEQEEIDRALKGTSQQAPQRIPGQ